MKNFLQRLLGNRSATPAQEPAGSESAEPGTVETPAESPKPKEAAKSHPEIGDAKLKLESARCDLHPLYPLLAATIEVQLPADLPGSSAVTQSRQHSPKMKVLRCTKARCDRCYTSEFGYFRFVAGQPSEIGELKTTRGCHLNHDTRYMVVTKIGGEFLWACSEEGCLNATPYEEAMPENHDASS